MATKKKQAAKGPQPAKKKPGRPRKNAKAGKSPSNPTLTPSEQEEPHKNDSESSSNTLSEPLGANQGKSSSDGYTPPPALNSQATGQSTEESQIPTPPPTQSTETEDAASSGKSRPTSGEPSKPSPTPKKTASPPSKERPLPAMVLGNKALECFNWSAEHDSDEEFLRRYGATGRPEQMQRLHGNDPDAKAALLRLSKLIA